MEDAFTGLRPAGRPDTFLDPVAQWRQVWEQDVVAAEARSDDAVAARRRDYGSYLFVSLDLLLAIIGPLILAAPLGILLVLIFVASGHALAVAGKMSPDLMTWLSSPLFSLIVTDTAIVLVVWYRLARQKLDWSVVGLGRNILRRGERVVEPGQPILIGLILGIAAILFVAPRRIGPVWAVLVGLILGVAALVLSAIVGTMSQWFHLNQSVQDAQLIDPLRHAPVWIVVLTVVAGTFVAPAVEELFFRGYVFRAIAVRKGAPIAYLFSAGVFGAFHLHPTIFPALFVVGLVLCFAYRRTGNLLTDMTAHALNNGVAFAIALHPLH